MYVAFRWLSALSFVMWLGLCSLDIYLSKYKASLFLSTNLSPYAVYKYSLYSNVTVLKDTKIQNVSEDWQEKRTYKQPPVAFFHYITFVTGALAVLIYNKKCSLITRCINKTGITSTSLKTDLKKTAVRVCVAMFNYWCVLREKFTILAARFLKQPETSRNTSLSLLKRLKDLVHDRKTLCQLLMAAIDENKNIRRQFQLEVIAKNRLLRYVQNTQNTMKENRSRYVDFQQLYLTTAKENNFLKSSIKKLRNERDNAQNNLLELINVVYRSNDRNLKAYCTRFLVQTKDNFLNSDVSEEIRKFLDKSNESTVNMSDRVDNKSLYLRKPMPSRVTEILEDDSNFVSLGSSGPRLRGLPGEFVWTVKDKNGIIEKLYEYNCETDDDNGDTIQRIRQYSVYHDKDCLLDHASLINIPTCPSLSASATRIRLDIKTFSSQRFLTKILLKNSPLRIPTPSETLPLPYASGDL